ncbi:type II 3-dehydroquinate dehydratase [Paracoccus sp. p3-h83]|uniref:type II 3-dehydroquinate dehydratase n=1 Tax=Paracoccus sp. p3-h83 TaxID=3342805 RepID=UPI0035BB7F6B
MTQPSATAPERLSILVLNGPNLNLLGTREPGIYGSVTLADVEQLCRDTGDRLNLGITCLQSNHEGALIDAIHAARGQHDGIVLNAGAYTHTSVALMDALSGVALPVAEVHLSNIHKRETFRHHSYISRVALGMICGFGAQGYALAIEALAGHLRA